MSPHNNSGWRSVVDTSDNRTEVIAPLCTELQSGERHIICAAEGLLAACF